MRRATRAQPKSLFAKQASQNLATAPSADATEKEGEEKTL